MTADLMKAFRASDVDDGELVQFLLSYFKSSSWVTDNEVVYPGPPADWAVKLVYDEKNTRLLAIEFGGALQEEDVAAIATRVKSELLETTATQIGREILFTAFPVKGFWQYGDTFQILPVPASAPTPSFQAADHPCVLELKSPTSPDLQLRVGRRVRRARELELLLNTFLEGWVMSRGVAARHHWVMLHTEEPPPWKYGYCQEGYGFEGFSYEGTAFSETVGLTEMTAVDPSTYYGRYGIEGRGLEVPADLRGSFDRYFGLSSEEKKKYIRAASWFQCFTRVWHISQSMAYTALISAIETLLPAEEAGPRCATCGKALRGPTDRFVDFVEGILPADQRSRAARREFYRLRSKLAHGGYLLRSDVVPFQSGHPKQWEEMWKSHGVWQIGRLTLRSWLWQAR